MPAVRRDVRLELVTHDNLDAFRTVRLRALREDPTGFSSSYEEESRFTEEQWHWRVDRWSGVVGLGVLAIDGDVCCGLAGALLGGATRTYSELVSVWVAPEYRRQRLASRLVQFLEVWSEMQFMREVRLMVTSSNAGAIAMYEDLGYKRTGRTEPYRNDSTLLEYEMAKMLL